MAMNLNQDQAGKHVTLLDSPWDGEMVEEMKTWGYKDDSDTDGVDRSCDMETKHGLSNSFAALGIQTDSWDNNGPNKCYRELHYDGPTVQRAQRRTTSCPSHHYNFIRSMVDNIG